MSGGHFDYSENQLAHSMFGWSMDVDYGEDGFSQSKVARNINPLDDRELSEMLWDMLCLIHSKDYYESGDTSKERYEKDLKYFKNKWMKRSESDVIAAYKQDIRNYADELIRELDKGWK